MKLYREENDKEITPYEVVMYMCNGRSPRIFIKQLFYYFRLHKDLLEKEDYNRLYEEVLDYLYNSEDRDFKGYSRKRYVKAYEEFMDTIILDKDCIIPAMTSMSEEEFEGFLAKRRETWKRYDK